MSNADNELEMIIPDTPEIRKAQEEIARQLKESNDWMESLTPEELDFNRWDPLDEAYDNEVEPQQYRWHPKTKEEKEMLGVIDNDTPIDFESDEDNPEYIAFMQRVNNNNFKASDDDIYDVHSTNEEYM